MKHTRRTVECRICMEKHHGDRVTSLDPCGHEFCRPCIKGYIGVKLAERRFPILCPICTAEDVKNGPGVVTNDVVKQVGIAEEQYRTWVELEMAKFSVPVHCRECNKTFSADREDFEAMSIISCQCMGCNHMWCKQCQQSISDDGPAHSCNGGLELEHLITQRGWKRCPSCTIPIERVMGCNHITCISPACNTHFCYVCGGVIIISALLTDINAAIVNHFRTCNM